jgi:hypothetical protein
MLGFLFGALLQSIGGLILVALQGALVSSAIAMKLDVGAPQLFVGYLLAYLGLRRYFPRVAYAIGLSVAAYWTFLWAAQAYHDPEFNSWVWVLGFGALGAILGSLANFLRPLELLYFAEALVLKHVPGLLARGRRRTSRPSASSGYTHTSTSSDSTWSSSSWSSSSGNGASRSRSSAPPPPLATHATDPWSILGIRPGSPADDIKRAYRERMRQYHPDKVASLGIELRELAERKAKEINEAYAALSGRP